MSLFQSITSLLSEGKTCVLVTIVDIKGSTPRKPGSRMLVHLDGKIDGTIGGGALEKQVIEDAIAMLHQQITNKKTYDLTRELGMCCGGRVEIFFEVLGRKDALYIFGAGHIAKPLAEMASIANFDVTIIDEREEFANSARFPKASNILCIPAEDSFSKLEFHPSLSVAVCTHDHVLDQRIVEKCITRPFRYLGLIGSRTKAAKVRSRLKAAGISEPTIDQLRCPMGLNVRAQTPEEIAISILAEIVGVKHGAESESASFSWEVRQKNVERPSHG